MGPLDLVIVAAGLTIAGLAKGVTGMGLPLIAVLFILYGVFQGIYRTIGKTLATDFVGPKLRASGVGWFSASCTQTITWTVDITPPVFADCPAPTLALGCNPAPASIPTCGSYNVTATDGCSTPTVSCDSATVTNGCVRTRTITYTAVDACNNTNTCSQTVTVVDTNPPAISLSQSCSPSIIENGQTVTFTGAVGNPGTVGLTNVVVRNLLLNSVVTR